MNTSTDELTRLLTGAADDIVEHRTAPGPDIPQLWRRGRRVTWAARTAAAGILGVVLLLVATGGVLLSGIPGHRPLGGRHAHLPRGRL